MKSVLAALTLTAAVLLAVMLLRGGSEGEKPVPAGQKAQPATAKTSSEVVLSITPGVGRNAAPAAQRKPSPLLLELRAAADFRPIHDRLKALPNRSPEESYFLAHILATCARDKDRPGPPRKFNVDEAKARFAASLSTKAPNRDKRVAAFDRAMRTGCESFGGVETTQGEIRDLLARAATAGEPKAQARLLSMEINEARQGPPGSVLLKPVPLTDEQIARMKAIVGSGDPGALMEVTMLMAFGNEGMHLRDPDEAPIDGSLLYTASILAACELGHPCGPDSRGLAHACAFNGYCDAADYRDYALFYELAPGNAQRAMLYRSQLLRAVREGDWSFFTFQPGPPPATAAFQTP